jgi:3-dehydroquinate dehydratase-1
MIHRQPSFCLPVQKETTLEVEQIVYKELARREYSYFEFWLDLIKDLEEDFIKEIVETLGERLIFLMRRPNLDPIHMTLYKRKEIINLLNHKKTFLDLDIEQNAELTYIHEEKLDINLITSYHNYKETPSQKELQLIIEHMKKHKPQIYKIATMCNNQHDALRLMEIINEFQEKKVAYCVVGMGKEGKIVRLYGMLSGNIMTFAPKNTAESSAIGQFTLEEAKLLYLIMKGKR